MINHQTLQFALAWRLGLLLLLVSAAAIAYLRWKACQVAAGYETDVAHAVLLEFLTDVAWTIPAFGVLALVMGNWAIRSGLAPLRALSADVSGIKPGSPSALLRASRTLPGEVVPLVRAVDGAFDRLHAAYEAERRFTSNAAHELRTPLAILQAGLERLPADPTMQALKEDAARLARIVAQLLELARVEAGPPIGHDTVELKRLVAEVAASLGPLAHERDVAIGLDSAASAIYVRGTPGLIEAIVRNVLENAILYANPGTAVSLTVTPAGLLTVDDQGPGIPPEQHGHLFERFWRGPQAGPKGSGLGLAIVKEVAARIGATIKLDSEPRRGTSFCVQFASAM
jgi:signal transduction histidine kinase